MSKSAERYWTTHKAETQKPIRIARHKRRMARKAAKLANRLRYAHLDSDVGLDAVAAATGEMT
jgi:hypothetical protein